MSLTLNSTEELLGYTVAKDLLAGQVILVTGAGSGLGREIARACAAHGATVILLGRTIKKLEMVYDSIVAAGHPEPAIYPMNLEGAAWNNYEELAATLQTEFGRLDGLVNNAVHFESLKPMAETTPPDWMKHLHINLNASLFMTQVCLGLLNASDNGSVIFMSDSAGAQAKPFWGPYAVAKAGLDCLSQLWAGELRNTGLRMNSLDPGPVKSKLHELAYPAAASNSFRQPQEVLPAILYLLGRDSEHVSGKRLVIEAPTQQV